MTIEKNNVWIIQNSLIVSDVYSKYQLNYQLNKEKELKQFEKEKEDKTNKQINEINKIDLLA